MTWRSTWRTNTKVRDVLLFSTSPPPPTSIFRHYIWIVLFSSSTLIFCFLLATGEEIFKCPWDECDYTAVKATALKSHYLGHTGKLSHRLIDWLYQVCFTQSILVFLQERSDMLVRTKAVSIARLFQDTLRHTLWPILVWFYWIICFVKISPKRGQHHEKSPCFFSSTLQKRNRSIAALRSVSLAERLLANWRSIVDVMSVGWSFSPQRLSPLPSLVSFFNVFLFRLGQRPHVCPKCDFSAAGAGKLHLV